MSNPLSKFFVAAGAKRLSAVETRPDTSNQHEFNGVVGFKNFFGSERITFDTDFLYLADEEEKEILEKGHLTWYDARENHPTRTEFRLYYSTNNPMKEAQEEDMVIIAKTAEDKLLVVICPKGSTHESQLLWLFGLEESENRFIVKDYSEQRAELGYAGKTIISSLGLEIEEEEPDYLEDMLKRFGNKLPSTFIFSEYARETLKNEVSPIENPDDTLIAWMEWEERLFRTFEKYQVQIKLKEGFGKDGLDVDDFISFSLSVQNKRKSRAGYAFENHLAEIFNVNSILYTRGAKTERNNKPDFLFPGIKEYFDKDFPTELLTMLGLKTTAKDRWRQIIPEADRISLKHLITLEPAISKNQTNEMKEQSVQLVIPANIFPTYSKEQQVEFLSLSDFIQLVRNRR
ncbi:type II restriction endonuclease [Algoriphagus sp. CAU 1675]|uniref:type II restriction endonuclease n=1 Tax=Algoriphagus sp. CAU 1675 TaxID=3032597 RepID=UPI0023DB6C2F|nr:type II restriction endonuclease [Algoriphagus sp. CAU 1675]MDF2157798.1 type II restriction endonuclease [Algoriphagus sp. CAU 1675]